MASRRMSAMDGGQKLEARATASGEAARTIVPGLCQCGCGGRTRNAPYSCASKDWRKGEPQRFIHGHQFNAKLSSEERFNQYVFPDPNSGCYIYAGAESCGYGSFVIGSRRDGSRKSIAAHLFAWLMAGNEKPPSGMVLRHKCHTRCCVNVDHLVVGTYADNSMDMAKARRGAKSRKGLPFGVSHQKNGRGFDVKVGPRGPRRYRGTFDSLEEAAVFAEKIRNEIYGSEKDA